MLTPSRSLSRRQMAQAALITLFGFLGSSVLGVVRLFIISQQFGTGDAMDAFVAAQRIPETIFVLVAGGAMGSAFIPVYARQRQQDEKAAWELASAVMTLSTLAAAILGLITVVLAPWIVSYILLPEKTPEVQLLTSNLMRLMILTPAIFAVGGLTGVLLQSHGLFTLPALAISMNSVGIIVGAVILAPMLKVGASVAQVGENNIYGLAWGAVLSALLYLIVQLPGLRQLKAPLRPIFDWRVPGVVSVLKLMVPRMLGLAVVQINFIVNVTLAGTMANGSIAALQYSWTLMFTSLGIIAQGISSALFPSLAALHSEGDTAGFKDRLSGAMRTVLFLALPATVAFIVFGRPIVQIFERGEWTAESTAATAWALAFYAIGLAGFALLEILSRAFYAMGDTRTPVIIGIVAMVGNIILSVVFVSSFGNPNQLVRGPFGYLALANALTTLAEAAILWWIMRQRIGDLSDRGIFVATFKAGIAACVMGLVLIIIQAWRDETGLITLILGGIIGGGTFFGISAALGLPEARSVPAMILRRIRR